MAGTDVTLPQAGDEVSASWGQSVAKNLNGVQAGTATIPNIISASQSQVVVTFPKPYVAAPVVAIAGSSAVVIFGVGSVTATQVTLIARRADGVATAYTGTVQWVAVGNPA